MQLKQDEKPFGSFFGISLWMRSDSLRGAGRRGQKRCKDSARREKNEKSLKALFFFCPSACNPIKSLLLPADGWHSGAIVLLHCGLKQSIRYYSRSAKSVGNFHGYNVTRIICDRVSVEIHGYL